MSGERVFTAAEGPIRAVLMAEGSALALFDARTRNTMVRLALHAGGRMWLQVFLPKRFSEYAKRLGYRVSARWAKEKLFLLGNAVPFIGFTPPGGGRQHPRWKRTNPEKMSVAVINGANAKATATASRAQLVFTIPYGHAVRPETSDALRTVPTWEVQRIAEEVASHLQRVLDGLLPATEITAPVPRAVPPAPRVSARGLGERSAGGLASRRAG